MILKGSRFGDLEIDENQILIFPKGIIGFPEIKRYILVDPNAKISWLQSVDESALALPIVPAPFVYPNYSLYIDDEVIEPLGETDVDLMGIYLVIVIPVNPKETTVNLKAPIVLSMKSMKGMQLLIDRPEYSINHKLLPEKKEA